MNRDEALRLRGRCSVWGCEEPTFAESLCSHHHAHAQNFGSEAIRSVNRTKKTRRPLGRTAAGPPQSNSLRPTYSARQGDSTWSYSDKAFPSSFTHPAPSYQESNHLLQHPPFPGPENPPIPRQKRATAEVIEVNASTITVEAMPPRPREPYFVLNPEFTSIDKKHSAYAHPRHNQDFSQSRYVSSNTIHQRSLGVVGGLVDTGLEIASNLNFPSAQLSPLLSNMSSSTQQNPPVAIPPARVVDVKLEDSLTITVAKTPSRRRSESGNTHKREGSTIHVYQKPAQIFKENLPIHISPKKRKADASDTQPRDKETSTRQRPEGSSTLSAPERESSESQFSNQPGDVYQTTPLGNLNQTHRPSYDQTTNQLRNSKKTRASTKLMPMIEVALAKANEQLENHTLLIQLENGGRQKSAHTFQQSQQPEPQANRPNDEQGSIIAVPPPTLETDIPVENDTITVAPHNTAELSTAVELTMAENSKTAEAHFFDSEAFDTMIYRQSMLHPPPGVSVQAPARPKTPVQKSPIEDLNQYLAINPAIHFPYNRSEEWYKEKALEIQSRGGRKAWFGKVIERRRWLRAKERAEDERNASIQNATRIDPQPWSYDRIIDFGDVPEEELPEDVLQNPAWVDACAWHRENQAKRILRDRATRNANREAWTEAERIMEDAKLAVRRNRKKQ